jgi:hypothetical protein
MKKLFTIALAALTALAVAGPASAAKPGKKLKPGKFKVHVEGEQLTTWDYVKEMAPQCDFPERDYGIQHIEFHTARDGDQKNAVAKVKPAAGGGVDVVEVVGVDDVRVDAHADIQRNWEARYADQAPCPGGGGSSGGDGDPPQNASGIETCDTYGELGIFMSPELADVENPSYPTDLTGKPESKAAFYFAADPLWNFDPALNNSLPVVCGENGMPNVSIGLSDSQGEYPGGIIPIAGSIPAKKLLGSKQRKVSFDMSRTVNYPNEVQTYAGPPKTTGRTSADVTITFTRVGR